MTRQQVIRQMILGACTMVLALPGMAGAAEGQPFADDIASGAQMKGICEENGGDFTDTEDGNLWCQWDDGSQTVCDTDGQDCYDIPYMPPKSSGPELDLDPVMQGSGGAAAPVLEGAVLGGAPLTQVAPDRDPVVFWQPAKFRAADGRKNPGQVAPNDEQQPATSAAASGKRGKPAKRANHGDHSDHDRHGKHGKRNHR